MNKEFQELKAQYGANAGQREQILNRMRENLKVRNGGKSSYTFQYINKNIIRNIDNCINVEDLYEIDGDMIVFAK